MVRPHEVLLGGHVGTLVLGEAAGRGDGEGGRGVDGVTQGGRRRLDGQVPQEPLLGLGGAKEPYIMSQPVVCLLSPSLVCGTGVSSCPRRLPGDPL